MDFLDDLKAHRRIIRLLWCSSSSSNDVALVQAALDACAGVALENSLTSSTSSFSLASVESISWLKSVIELTALAFTIPFNRPVFSRALHRVRKGMLQAMEYWIEKKKDGLIDCLGRRSREKREGRPRVECSPQELYGKHSIPLERRGGRRKETTVIIEEEMDRLDCLSHYIDSLECLEKVWHDVCESAPAGDGTRPLVYPREGEGSDRGDTWKVPEVFLLTPRWRVVGHPAQRTVWRDVHLSASALLQQLGEKAWSLSDLQWYALGILYSYLSFSCHCLEFSAKWWEWLTHDESCKSGYWKRGMHSYRMRGKGEDVPYIGARLRTENDMLGYFEDLQALWSRRSRISQLEKTRRRVRKGGGDEGGSHERTCGRSNDRSDAWEEKDGKAPRLSGRHRVELLRLSYFRIYCRSCEVCSSPAGLPFSFFTSSRTLLSLPAQGSDVLRFPTEPQDAHSGRSREERHHSSGMDATTPRERYVGDGTLLPSASSCSPFPLPRAEAVAMGSHPDVSPPLSFPIHTLPSLKSTTMTGPRLENSSPRYPTTHECGGLPANARPFFSCLPIQLFQVYRRMTYRVVLMCSTALPLGKVMRVVERVGGKRNTRGTAFPFTSQCALTSASRFSSVPQPKEGRQGHYNDRVYSAPHPIMVGVPHESTCVECEELPARRVQTANEWESEEEKDRRLQNGPLGRPCVSKRAQRSKEEEKMEGTLLHHAAHKEHQYVGKDGEEGRWTGPRGTVEGEKGKEESSLIAQHSLPQDEDGTPMACPHPRDRQPFLEAGSTAVASPLHHALHSYLSSSSSSWATAADSSPRLLSSRMPPPLLPFRSPSSLCGAPLLTDLFSKIVENDPALFFAWKEALQESCTTTEGEIRASPMLLIVSKNSTPRHEEMKKVRGEQTVLRASSSFASPRLWTFSSVPPVSSVLSSAPLCKVAAHGSTRLLKESIEKEGSKEDHDTNTPLPTTSSPSRSYTSMEVARGVVESPVQNEYHDIIRTRPVHKQKGCCAIAPSKRQARGEENEEMERDESSKAARYRVQLMWPFHLCAAISEGGKRKGEHDIPCHFHEEGQVHYWRCIVEECMATIARAERGENTQVDFEHPSNDPPYDLRKPRAPSMLFASKTKDFYIFFHFLSNLEVYVRRFGNEMDVLPEWYFVFAVPSAYSGEELKKEWEAFFLLSERAQANGIRRISSQRIGLAEEEEIYSASDSRITSRNSLMMKRKHILEKAYRAWIGMLDSE